MTNKNSSLFGDIATSVSSQSKRSSSNSKPTMGRYLSDRKNSISGLVDGSIEEKTLQWVDPALCKMWPYHNRRYDLLNEHRCRDLIEGIHSQGKQEFPAIVREINDPDYKYEVICGARRHWVISHLRNQNYKQFKFLIEIRKLSDEEAFRISDVENRDRQDISDYERAIDYARAVKNFYSSQKQMAERLEVSQAWLSRYLDLAKIPESIVNLFSDFTFITVEHGRKLKPLLNDPKTRKLLQERIEQILQLKHEHGQLWPDVKVFNFLMHGPKVNEGSSVAKSFSLPGSSKSVLKLKKSAQGDLTFTIKSFGLEKRAQLSELVLSILESEA